MVHMHAPLPFRTPGPARHDDKRRLLRVGACDGIDHVEAACAVGDTADAEPPRDARGSVRRESHRGFVTEADQPEPAIVFECFVEVEHEVARDPEDLPHAGAPETIEQEGVQLHGRQN